MSVGTEILLNPSEYREKEQFMRVQTNGLDQFGKMVE